MAQAPDFSDFVSEVVLWARDSTPRETVELGVLHGLCVDVARQKAPDLIEFLNTVGGLQALAGALSRMPERLVAVDAIGGAWRFVRN